MCSIQLAWLSHVTAPAYLSRSSLSLSLSSGQFTATQPLAQRNTAVICTSPLTSITAIPSPAQNDESRTASPEQQIQNGESKWPNTTNNRTPKPLKTSNSSRRHTDPTQVHRPLHSPSARDSVHRTQLHRHMAAEQGPEPEQGPGEEEEGEQEGLGLDPGLVDGWVSRVDCVRGG